jgi:hypothetical protein
LVTFLPRHPSLDRGGGVCEGSRGRRRQGQGQGQEAGEGGGGAAYAVEAPGSAGEGARSP